MKSVLISIQPYYVFLIIAKAMGWNISQEKTIEVRKDYPKDKAWDRITKIYCSKNKTSFKRIPKQYQPFMEKLLGKVVGEFICDKIKDFSPCAVRLCGLDYNICVSDFFATCLTDEELNTYGKGKPLCGWHISDLKIYDKPKELGEFFVKGNCENFDYCYRCKYYDKGNESAGLESDCSVAYDDLKSLSYPFQSWGYVEK